MKIAEFPFRKIGKEYLGIIRRPYATVLIKGKNDEWLPIEMIVDSGADYTLLPKRYAEILGIDLIDCVPKTTLGVGGSETVYLYKSLTIRLGKWQKKIPVGFLERDDIPALLGRLEFIEALEVTFKNFNTIFRK
ncbi:MAG: retroviral-like aspartic protease family protein [candidate division WOR-3 bacterium]|nr:retroviral-like aspartic protease family protein [candidate division WOR-3 bacterium]